MSTTNVQQYVIKCRQGCFREMYTDYLFSSYLCGKKKTFLLRWVLTFSADGKGKQDGHSATLNLLQDGVSCSSALHYSCRVNERLTAVCCRLAASLRKPFTGTGDSDTCLVNRLGPRHTAYSDASWLSFVALTANIHGFILYSCAGCWNSTWTSSADGELLHVDLLFNNIAGVVSPKTEFN